MLRSPSPASAPLASEKRGEVLVVVDAGPGGPAGLVASSLQQRLSGGIAGRAVTVLVAASLPEIALVRPDDPRAAASSVVPTDLAAGGIAGAISALGPVLAEADRLAVGAVALVSGAERGAGVDWLRLLLAPILEGDFEYVCPTYQRAKLDGLLGTAIVNPLTRALYGVRLRQPAGGEAAVSLELARRLLADPDWRRDPGHAGSDAWLVAKVLSERRRTCQAWLGPWPGDDGTAEDATHALARLVGPAFREMERHAEHWQQVEGSEPVATVGQPGALGDGSAHVDVTALAATFQLGLRELDEIWGLVLPPATRLALRRAAAAPPGSLRMDDGLWARVVYDFAVAHSTRAIERHLLLGSMTPLYLGWVAGFVNDVQALDGAATEARVEAVCTAFEREKRYAIRRWRWPDSFNP